MLIFIPFLLFGIFFAFSLYAKKFKTKFVLIYLFGKKGAGKSTLMVKWMLRDLRNGWHVYTDMKGVHIPGVRLFKTDDLADHQPEAPAALYLDEVGLSMNNRNFKTFPAGTTEFFALQRKYFSKVVCNSQAYDVDLKVRQRVDHMFLCTSIAGVIGVARPILRTVTLTEASSQGESRIADQLKFDHLWRWKFTWLPRYFPWFESFNAPPRPQLTFSECQDEKDLPKKLLRKLQRNYRRCERSD